MVYLCQNCGVEAEDEFSLCNPVEDVLEGKLCDVVAVTEQVCEDKHEEMKFTCDSCGRTSADAQYLCHPNESN